MAAPSKSYMSIEDVNKKLDEGLENVFKSERFRDLLNVMSRFHNYSLNNTLLIMGQKPNATMVQGYKGWQELGRHVNKGEKQIKILAPIIKKVEVEKQDPVTKSPVLDKDGNPIKDKQNALTGFRLVGVFDVSQTDGKELPSVRDFINRDIQNDENMRKLYNDFFKYVEDNTKFDIKEEPTEKGVGGFFKPSTDEIVISSSENKNDSEKFRVLIHEYAHAQLHHKDSELKTLPRGHKEAQAESVAYVVSNYYGLDTDDVSLGYIATWSQDLKLARKALNEVQDVSKDIIHTLDTLQKEKIQEFYSDREQMYSQTIEYLKREEKVPENAFAKDNKQLNQFELLQKDTGYIVSAKLEYSDRVDKMHLRTDRNLIIPLSELHHKGNYKLLNKEIENDRPLEITQYRRISAITQVTKVDNDKYAVVNVAGKDLISKGFTTKGEAEKHLLRLNLTQSLHQMQFVKSQVQNAVATDKISQIKSNVEFQVNYDVSKYLTHETNKAFIPKGENGVTIGWTLLKNPSIKNVDDLQNFIDKTRHMSSYENLRNAFNNADKNIESPSIKHERELEIER